MDKIALVLVGHGSVLPHNKEMIETFSGMMKERGGYDIVEHAFIQINEPLLDDVLMGLADNGIKKVVLSPVFLAKGVHTTSDITKAIKRAQDKTGIKIGYADPLGADPRIADILLERAKDARARIE